MEEVDRINEESLNIIDKRDLEMKDTFNDLGVDYTDIEEADEINPKFTSKSADKIISIQSIAEDFEMILLGREKIIKGENELYKQTSKAIAGSSFIKLVGGMLRSFSDESNLIGDKKIEDFVSQFVDGFNKVSSTMMRDRSISEMNHKLILKIYKDRMWNIGDIITNTKNNMEKVFGNDERLDENQFKKNPLGDA